MNESHASPIPPAAAPPESASVLGVVSLGLALLSVAACLIASVAAATGRPGAMVVVLVLPILGFAAMIAGALALMKRRSAGVPLVRGPAAFGIIIGLASVVLQGSVAVGALIAYVPVKRIVVPVVSSMFAEAEAGHPDRALAAIVESSRTTIDAPRLGAFIRSATDALGTPTRARVGLDIFFRSREALAEAMARGQSRGPAPDLGLQVKALELEGPSGRTVMYLVLDDAALKQDQVRIADAMVILPGGRCVVLLPQGRMMQLAAYLGLTVVNHP
jgi:hypothetical protein